jgi:DNA-binding NarL/FixJ family response regulator
VGREAELQLIRDAMRSGVGIVLAGGPGVGKTRLATEALNSADPRRYVNLWVTATSETTSIPLGALAPLLPFELGVTGNPVTLLRAGTDALLERCGSRSLVLGVDDAHLLDEISATLVHHLVQTRKAFVLISLLSRQSVPDPIRALWKNELAGRIEVDPPSLATVTEVLVAALDGQVDTATARRLWRTVRGNMALLRELVEAGVDSGALTEIAGVWRWDGPWVLTPRLIAAVCDRIGHLSRQEQDVLEILAYGEPIGADLLTRLVDRRAVEAVESRDLLSVRHDGRRVEIRLGQPLYGEVMRAGCSPRRAAQWRRKLADAVESAGARRPGDWMSIATWRLDATGEVGSDVLVAAARSAFATLDLPLAERLAIAALAVPDAGARSAMAASAVLWRVLLLSQRSTEAEEMLGELDQIPMSDAERADHAAGRAYHLFSGLRRVDEAFAVLSEARQAIDDAGRQDEIDLLVCLFQVLKAAVRPATAGLAALRARPRLSARAAAQLPAVQGMALLHQGRLTDAQDALDLAKNALAPWTEELPWIAEMRSLYRCYAALFAGRLAEAAQLAAEFHDHTIEREWDFALRLSCGAQAQVARLRGRVHAAARWAREGRRVHAYLPDAPFRNHVLAELACAEALAGHRTAAVGALQAAQRSPAVSELFLQPWVDLARPWVAVVTGDRGHAMDLAIEAARSAREREAPCFEAFALHDAVRLGAAEQAVDRLHELVDMVDSDLVRTFAEHAAAVVLDDPERLETVGAWFAGVGADLLSAETYVQAAHAYRRGGAAAGERWLRTRAALLLDGCEGARTPLVSGIQAPQLTPRERDVARLAAAGLSNQDIAERLVLSPRTVGNHLHRVYTKIGIGERSSLAELLPALHPQL